MSVLSKNLASLLLMVMLVGAANSGGYVVKDEDYAFVNGGWANLSESSYYPGFIDITLRGYGDGPLYGFDDHFDSYTLKVVINDQTCKNSFDSSDFGRVMIMSRGEGFVLDCEGKKPIKIAFNNGSSDLSNKIIFLDYRIDENVHNCMPEFFSTGWLESLSKDCEKDGVVVYVKEDFNSAEEW